MTAADLDRLAQRLDHPPAHGGVQLVLLENRRQEEARLEAQRKASPMYRIRELEKKLGEALGEQPPSST
jgi:hypothetical protein